MRHRILARPAGFSTLIVVEMEITVPNEIAVMTLPEVTFFPQALMPLHIFEPRYRQMLKDVLATHRIFAVAGLHPESDPTEERGQRIATAGIVRACNLNDDGTSNLLLHGLVRVNSLGIVNEDPYRVIRVEPLTTEGAPTSATNLRLRQRIERLISMRHQLGGATPDGFAQFLKSVDDLDAFIDLAAFTLCPDASLKQRLLETLDVSQRLRLYGEALRREIDQLSLHRKLQGDLDDEEISNN